MRRSRLDLPEPLGPVRSSAPPGGRAKSRPAKTSRPPRRHCRDRPSKSPWSGLLCPERAAAAVGCENNVIIPLIYIPARRQRRQYGERNFSRGGDRAEQGEGG